MALIRPRKYRRAGSRGSALTGVMLTLMVFGGLAATAYILRPQRGMADQRGGEAVKPQQESHRVFAADLQALLGATVKVLALHDDAVTGRIDLVIWMQDSTGPGVIDASEVAMLSYSPILQTLELYALEEGDAPEAVCGGLWLEAGVGDATFPGRWRQCEAIDRIVLGTGLSDFVVGIAEHGADDVALLRIDLKWSPESVDGPDDGRVLVNVLLR